MLKEKLVEKLNQEYKRKDFDIPFDTYAEIKRRDGKEKAASNPKEYLELISKYDQEDPHLAVINFYKDPEIITHGEDHEQVLKQAYEKGHTDAILLPYDPGLVEILEKV